MSNMNRTIGKYAFDTPIAVVDFDDAFGLRVVRVGIRIGAGVAIGHTVVVCFRVLHCSLRTDGARSDLWHPLGLVSTNDYLGQLPPSIHRGP